MGSRGEVVAQAERLFVFHEMGILILQILSGFCTLSATLYLPIPRQSGQLRARLCNRFNILETSVSKETATSQQLSSTEISHCQG